MIAAKTWKRGLARLLAGSCVLSLAGCYLLRASSGGGQATFEPPRQIRPADIALPEGYRIEAVATGLTYPTDITFDDAGRPYVLEAGYSYGGERLEGRLSRLESSGELTPIATGSNPPWNGVAFHQGAFYVAAGGHLGRLVRVTMNGTVTPIVKDLPSFGDHHTNGPIVGPDGWLYFSQGTVTNSGVVGLDNWKFGWLKDYPDFHDVPGEDVVLRGRNFTTENPFTEDPNDRATTGAFVPFGVATQEGQVIKGALKSGGSVFRVRPDGTGLDRLAWGFRNPFGLAFSPGGQLFVTENGFDKRGSRPVFGGADFLWEVKRGLWYGWPDFAGGIPLADPRFKPFGTEKPGFLLAKHPNPPPKPAASFGAHSSSSGITFSRNAAFGYKGQAFVAQFGDLAPEVGKVLAPVGYKVVRVDVATGVIQDFAINQGPTNAPASKLESGGLERPVNVRFDPGGERLYIVDFGVLTVRDQAMVPHPGTGVVWRISREVQP